jgi:hypothetical protein
MELKQVKDRDVGGPLDMYAVSPAEAARARVGLNLSGKESIASVPSTRHDSLRSGAEAVVIGNLALLQGVSLEVILSIPELAAAHETVQSGLKALEEGAAQVDAIYDMQFSTNR